MCPYPDAAVYPGLPPTVKSAWMTSKTLPRTSLALAATCSSVCTCLVSHSAGALRAEQIVERIPHKEVAACGCPPICALPRHPLPLLDQLEVVPSRVVRVQDLHATHHNEP